MLAWYPGDNFRQVIPAWFAQQNYFPLPCCLDRCSLYLYHAEVELLRKKNRHNNVVRSTNPWVKIGAKTGLDKRALSLSRTSRFPFWENNISFSLARPIIKLATLGQGKQNWEQGKAGIHVFFANPEKSVFITHNSIPWSDFEQSVFRLDRWADRGTMRGRFFLLLFSGIADKTIKGILEVCQNSLKNLRRPQDTCFSPGIHIALNRPFHSESSCLSFIRMTVHQASIW